MKARALTLTDQSGNVWSVGQPVYIPDFDYTGEILFLYGATANQPARAHVGREGDAWGRTVTLDNLRVVG